eukprot:m.37567 g.37567  ORF g.37567 m.37567 type:complete len:72 (-) comp12518_c0_seq1:497-712(-)
MGRWFSRYSGNSQEGSGLGLAASPARTSAFMNLSKSTLYATGVELTYATFEDKTINGASTDSSIIAERVGL